MPPTGKVARAERTGELEEGEHRAHVVEHVVMGPRLDEGEERDHRATANKDAKQSLDVRERARDARDHEVQQQEAEEEETLLDRRRGEAGLVETCTAGGD